MRYGFARSYSLRRSEIDFAFVVRSDFDRLPQHLHGGGVVAGAGQCGGECVEPDRYLFAFELDGPFGPLDG